MIIFNEKDFYMPTIKRDAKLSNLVTKNKYRVYGLKKNENPPILIEYQYGVLGYSKSRILTDFFLKNGVKVEVCEDQDREIKGFSIGLRRDLRENALFAATVLQTIVYYLEGRLELKDFKFNLPKNLIVKPKKEVKRDIIKEIVKEASKPVAMEPIAFRRSDDSADETFF